MRNILVRPGRPTTVVACIGAASLIAIVWGVALTVLAFDRGQTIDAAVRENQNRAIAFEQFVTRTLETADVAAEHLALRMANQIGDAARVGVTPVAAPPRLLRDPIASNSLFGEVVVTDARGRALYSTIVDSPPLDIGASRGLKRLQDGENGPLVSRPRLSRTFHKPFFSVTRAIRDSRGRFLGTVIVETPIERLTAFNQGARTRPLDLISVIRSDGATLARRHGSRISYGQNLSGTSVMRQQARDPNGTQLGPSVLDGKLRFFSHRRLKQYPVFVTVGIGEADVLAPVREHRDLGLAAATALSVAIAALALLVATGARRREKAASLLRETNRRFDAAQRIARIGDWTLDPATRMVSLSAALCEMYGRPADRRDLPLDEVLAAFDPADREHFLAAMEAAIETRAPQHIECTVEASSGARSVRRLVFEPVLARDGKVGLLSGTDQDISQEKLNARLRDDIAHRERVESMNLIAATLAHELSQPLTAAGNYLMLARIQSGEAEGPIADSLKQVDGQLALAQEIMRRAADMLNRRCDADARAPVAAIVDDAVYLAKVANRHRPVDIRVPALADGLEVAANRVHVQQVLMNLLRNAVEAASGSESPCVALRAEAGADMVTFCVEDNGAGFPAGAADPFAPFAGESRNGLGLGLSISRAIVETYGGAIWLKRDARAGASVYFRLPRAA